MKLLINTSTLSGTGVTQVAVSFLEECKKHNNKYFVFLSKRVDSQLDKSSFPENFKFYIIKRQPRYFLKSLFTRLYLKRTEKAINPDCVFSVFGPSYWTPKAPHLMGYAYPHYVYSDSPIFKILTKREKIKVYIYKMIHKYMLTKNGQYYVCETENVSSRLIQYLRINKSNIFTVTNTYNHYFENFIPQTLFLKKKENNEFRFLSLCSFAKHKNLTILNKIIPLLKKTNLNITFILTIDNKLFLRYFTAEARESIINLKSIDVSSCPEIYYECDALFLPTLLECFSANYVEAMKMGKPIMTSNLPFATSVCQDAAIYFDPFNEIEIAQKMIELITNKKIYKEMIHKGRHALSRFDTASERAEKYISICKLIADKKNSYAQ